MPFIGTQPDVGGYSVLDNLTASATASYTLQKDSANFVPSSANQLLVSLNGVIQKPGSSFTVSGSTLTFSSALTSSDSIDFILAMGEPLLVGTPSDGAVNTTQLATNAVTNAKISSGIDASKLTTGDVPFAQLDNTFTKATIDLSSTQVFTGIPVGVNIIHIAMFNVSSNNDIRVQLRTGGSTVTSNYFSGLAYRYTGGSNSYPSEGGVTLTTGILTPGSWQSGALINLVGTIVRNQTADDSNPSYSASAVVFYRNYNTHGGAGYMQGINTGLGGVLDGIAVNSAGTIASGKATIYYR